MKRKEIVKTGYEVTDHASFPEENKLFLGTEHGEIMTYEEGEKIEHYFESELSINSLQFNKKLYALLGNDRIVRFEEGKITFNYSSDERIDGFCVSPNGSVAVWNENAGIYVLSQDSKRNISKRKGITDCSFSNDGKLAVAYEDKLEIYNSTTSTLLFERKLKKGMNLVEFTEYDERVVFSDGRKNFNLRDLESEELITEIGFEEDQIEDLTVYGEKIFVTTSNRIHVFDSAGILKTKIHPQPEVPLFFPLVAIGTFVLGALIIWSELDRQSPEGGNYHFKENKIPFDEAILLGTLGIFSLVCFIFYLFIQKDLLIPIGLWISIFFVGSLWIPSMVGFIGMFREVKINSETLYLSTSILQEHFKNMVRKVDLDEMKEIKPDYNKKSSEKRGYEILTIDGRKGKILFSIGRDRKIKEFEKAMNEVLGSKWNNIYEGNHAYEKKSDDFLYYTKEDWDEIQRKIRLEKPVIFGMVGIMALLLISVAVGSAHENVFLVLFSALVPPPILLLLAFYNKKVFDARKEVKKAVEHELKTEKNILPPEFQIPESIIGGPISREPIDVTEKEKKKAEKCDDNLHHLKVIIIFSIGLFLPIATALVYPELFEGTIGSYLLFLLIMLPVIFFIFYFIWTGKKLQKVKEARKINDLLENEKEKN
ncbi:MAG: hypothetical protein KGY66_02505 [Candidatus Thermoplasmatota archaeon]|nr:hypothetical protein [Candidatus Thermoplasmatota archaeon]